jgi:hypothetical protein
VSGERGTNDTLPRVRLGRMVDDGVAPSILGLLERGVERRPRIASQMRGRIVFRFAEEFSPLRIAFKPKTVVIEDGDLRKPDLVIAGTLPDIVHFLTVPVLGGPFGGFPNPTKARGRAALARVASGRLRVEGNRALGRRLVQLLAL